MIIHLQFVTPSGISACLNAVCRSNTVLLCVALCFLTQAVQQAHGIASFISDCCCVPCPGLLLLQVEQIRGGE
jgi:hypothetical protein